MQQPSLPYYSDSRNKQTNQLLNSLSLTSPTLHNVIPLNAALTNEKKNIINQQVKNYVALNNSKASYEVLYENPTSGAQGRIEINSVILDYSPIILKDNDTLKRRWDIIFGFVDMLKKAKNEQGNIFDYRLSHQKSWTYLTPEVK